MKIHQQITLSCAVERKPATTMDNVYTVARAYMYPRSDWVAIGVGSKDTQHLSFAEWDEFKAAVDALIEASNQPSYTP